MKKEIQIDISKTVDELLKCWDSKIKYQNYMRKIDEMILGPGKEELFQTENDYVESPDIRFRDNLEIEKSGGSFHNIEDNVFKSSLQKINKNNNNPFENHRKKTNINNKAENDFQTNLKQSNNAGISNHSYESDLSNKSESNLKNMLNKKYENQNMVNKRYSKD